jgi:hypothetical protein
MKANESEPPMTGRNHSDDVKTGAFKGGSGSSVGEDLFGDRHDVRP